jgi:hypothetical protein
MSLDHHIGMTAPEWRLETTGRKRYQQPQKIFELDQIHEPAAFCAAVLYAALVQPFHRLAKRRLQDGIRHLMHRPF